MRELDGRLPLAEHNKTDADGSRCVQTHYTFNSNQAEVIPRSKRLCRKYDIDR